MPSPTCRPPRSRSRSTSSPATRTRCSWLSALQPPISPARRARPTPCIGYTTPGRWNRPGTAIVKRGGDSWFFLTADYAFGYALERDTEAVVVKSGGKVLGKVRHPFPGTDFLSFLLQAKASKAKIIGLANAGGDTINSIK